MLGVMGPVLDVENGHSYGVKNGRILRCRQESFCGRAERPWGCARRSFELHAISFVPQAIHRGGGE